MSPAAVAKMTAKSTMFTASMSAAAPAARRAAGSGSTASRA
jgi:hypothetical protein